MKHPRNFDKSAAGLVAQIPKRYERVLTFITNIGGFWFAAFVLFILGTTALITGERSLMKNVTAIAALTPLAELTKYITRRKRPETLYAEQMRFKTYSFPSGHAYASALMSGFSSLLALIYIAAPLSWFMAILLLSFALVVGISRVYVGAHFPSDVVGGWLLAVLVLYLTSPYREMLR